MEIIYAPAELPADVSALPDDTLISPPVWAKLQGVKLSTVHSKHTVSKRHRREGAPKASDMPPEDLKVGVVPMWRMGTFRAWEAARPGQGAGAGRPRKPGGPKPRSWRVYLPIVCPHCRHEVTAADLGK